MEKKANMVSCGQRGKKAFLRRMLCLALSVLLFAGTILPVAAYEAPGTEGLSKGELEILDAVYLNFWDYTNRIIDAKQEEITDSLIEEITGISLPEIPLPPAVKEINKLLEVSAYVFVDLGKAIAAWPSAQKEVFYEITGWYEDIMLTGARAIEEAYALGFSHRGRQTAVPTNALRNLQCGMTSKQTLLVNNIEEMKGKLLFSLSSKYPKKIQALADAGREYMNKMPSLEYIYSIARYGSADGTDNIVTILTNEKCWIVNKATGKNLNVYTDRAAKDLKNGDRISVYEATGHETQEFLFIKNSDNTYRIRVYGCKKYLDLYNTGSSIAKLGARAQIWGKSTDEHYKDQCFIFEKENGYYRILLAANPNYCLYVKSNGFVALGKVQKGDPMQLWSLIYEG